MKLGSPAFLGGASAAGISAAAGGYYVMNSHGTTIKEQLKDRKFIPSSDDALWTEEFKSDSANMKISIEALKDATDFDGGSKLKSWCESQMELDSKKNSKSLELVEKYCLIRDLSSQLSRQNKTLLVGSDSKEAWNATYSKRKTKTSTRADVGLQGTNWTEDTDLPIIKSWCDENSKKEFSVSSQKDIYPKLVSWCTKEAANEQ
ncbi:hypothetical protein HF1_11570 [Mycoplasma haemofelis str. Langford 1]|uniref:Uncharacterized protein n=1 Tax=Mycoplasma haemofelis (strain Langford 1) TaxID=941640 RepID=E8ZJ44_MYCHL|nr:hypothetical protein [Mycoplasma haemofelis]CBY93165.1 hypothetical protein HF1_11570 [Mycoplasma haemofelis str. Langford 1]